jgi:YebC/PmpR family DNA-binding regulatory protein
MGRAYEVRKASIQKTGAARGKVYAMYAKEIYSAAKKSTDPDANPTLKRLIEKAKREQVRGDLVKRAIDKVNSGVDESYENLRYEGFGPGASTILIDCLTDNVNRAISYVRAAFAKAHCKLGASGAVSYMYDNLCVISFKGLTADQTIEALLNGEVDADVEVEGDTVTLYGIPQDLYKIKNAILAYKSDIVFDIDELTTIAKETIELTGEDLELFKRLLQLLDDIEDVQNVYHNVRLD